MILGIKMMAWFVIPTNPWFKRGYHFNHGLGAGVFTFVNANGHADGNGSFRVVLVSTLIFLFF